MNIDELWSRFFASGSVLDYLAYRKKDTDIKEQDAIEIHDRRIDNKREQCR